MTKIVIIVCFSVLALVAFMVWVIAKPIYEQKQLEKGNDQDFMEMPEPKAVGAHVLKKELTEEKYGTKTMHYDLSFTITFLTDDGETKIFSVPQKLYDTVSEGQSGMLVTVCDHFFDFGDGESISHDESESNPYI